MGLSPRATTYVLPLLMGGCLYHATVDPARALATPDAEVYVSSESYPDGQVRRQVIERFGPVDAESCEQILIDVIEYTPAGRVEQARRELRKCEVVREATEWKPDESGCRIVTFFDFDADGRIDYELAGRAETKCDEVILGADQTVISYAVSE